MLRLVTVCRPAKAFIFDSRHPDVCTAIIIIIVATSRPTSFFKGDVTERFATTIFSATQRCNEHLCDIVPALQRCVALKIVMGIVPCNITLTSGASCRPRNGQAIDEVARGRPRAILNRTKDFFESQLSNDRYFLGVQLKCVTYCV